MNNVCLFGQSRATWPRPLQRKHVISRVPPVVDAAPDGVVPMAGVAPTGVAVLSRGVGVDGIGRAGAELDESFYLQKS
jgi:hypothetical protein